MPRSERPSKPEDDSEDDDHLSPTDGHFNSNQIHQNIIRHPTTPFEESHSKVRAAMDDASKGRDVSPSRQMSSNTHASAPVSPHGRRDDSSYHHESFFDQPPPAYIASVGSAPVAAQGQRTPANYETFSRHRLEGGSSRERQSIRESANDPGTNERTPIWLYRAPEKISSQRKIVTKILGIGLVLVIIVLLSSGTLGTFIGISKPDSNMGGGPSRNAGPYCQHISKSEQTTFEIPKALGLVVLQEFHEQKPPPRDGTEVVTAGEVRIRTLPGNSHGEKAHFTIDIKLSHPGLSAERIFDEDNGSLKIITPRFARSGAYDRPCISIEITAWIPKDAHIPKVFFDLITLSIRLFDDDNIKVDGDAVFKTVSGHVHFPQHSSPSTIIAAEIQSRTNFELDSRRIIVETVSGRIEGAYPLYDLLELASQSGAIVVDIYPKPVLESAPSPATLNIHTSSGRIEVQSPVRVPQATHPREYITRVGSISGAIRGDFFIGPTAIFNTTSGRIQLVARPILPATSGDDERRNVFSTHSISGASHVTLLDPLFIIPVGYTVEDPIYSTYAPGLITLSSPFSIQPSKSKLRTFHSTHQSTSGRVEAYYPPSWIGNIEAKTISGRIGVEGKGIQIVTRNDGWGSKRIQARKGVERDEDGGSVGLKTVNGAILLRIAEGL
ncbi:hypothetical protein DSL72_003168 [Monilinia vaccinii-corymbosi]|uniref:Adhesin domain-containing protein n=1 Tax=Monilinia vaccinii-corymbosi TaxID=61207 RepID=A0A8A3P7L5_9HELO|nr:hypothetical protein DSL72_003168 [Monilinia vaccinii-corymbosi]